MIKDKIPEVLNASTIQDEFAHTVLHGRDVFAELEEKNRQKKQRKISGASSNGGLSNENTIGSLNIDIESDKQPSKAKSGAELEMDHLLSLYPKDF